ncbi:hypothetical protein NDU88_001756 [Pleurodeles waltl]|uniref:Uncharacterized protein n=1 Tax=Pleurodeles waltl TaxID=8319 RepID=A0AAV7SCH5_PLEWA|nr:hypothetical protein NDU88_001756 [Pleurodeles waltl]
MAAAELENPAPPPLHGGRGDPVAGRHFARKAVTSECGCPGGAFVHTEEASRTGTASPRTDPGGNSELPAAPDRGGSAFPRLSFGPHSFRTSFVPPVSYTVPPFKVKNTSQFSYSGLHLSLWMHLDVCNEHCGWNASVFWIQMHRTP